MKRVLIADDHPIFRAGLRQIVEEEGYEVVGEAGDGKSCIAGLQIIKPDIVVLDLAMPGIDGYGVLKWIGEHMPSITAVVLSMHSARGFATRAKKLGARAFVAKEDTANELCRAFITPQGVFYSSASVTGNDISPEEPKPVALNEKKHVNLLTPAEQRVFDLVGKSLTSRQIGERLNLSFRTVQTHRQRINQKLELKGSNSLLQYAIRYFDNN